MIYSDDFKGVLFIKKLRADLHGSTFVDMLTEVIQLQIRQHIDSNYSMWRLKTKSAVSSFTMCQVWLVWSTEKQHLSDWSLYSMIYNTNWDWPRPEARPQTLPLWSQGKDHRTPNWGKVPYSQSSKHTRTVSPHPQ